MSIKNVVRYARIQLANGLIEAARIVGNSKICGPDMAVSSPRADGSVEADIWGTLVDEAPMGTLVLRLNQNIPRCRAVKLIGVDMDEVLFVDEDPIGQLVKIRRPTAQPYPVGTKAKVIQ